MNLIHMKYAIVVAETNSINKAAEILFVGAPALSRAIKELETGLGVILFDRSAKGMTLTPDGELFVRYAKKILKQVEDVEAIFNNGTIAKEQFSISVPRASYIASAFAKFSNTLDLSQETELFYRETNAYRVITNILKKDYKLGILRYSEKFDDYYKTMMDEKNLVGELITEFSYVVIMSKDNPLSKQKKLLAKDLNGYIEIAHADPYVPSLPVSEVKKSELSEHIGSRIFVFERASQFELLSKNPNTYMWVSPVPEELLNQYGLIEIDCADNHKKYKDVLIHHRNYTLSKLDTVFVEELIKEKRRIFKGA